MLSFAKPIEELKSAPESVIRAMNNFVLSHDAYSELRGDISERFHYPSLWAAIDRLVDIACKKELAYAELCAAGYTADDAFTLCWHETKDGADHE